MVHALALLVGALAGAPAPLPAGPTVAREDTLYTSVPEVLVHAPRVTLDEILDRVARGEARRESLITDQSFRATLRLVANPARGRFGPDSAAGHGPRLLRETVAQVYRKRPDRVRTVVLREWKARPGEKDPFRVSFGPDMGEELVNFAFQPGARRDFKYHIAGRDLLGDHLIYRIAFEPRSRLDPSIPSGLVWVDTNDFVIVRQEVRFDRSPVPLFLKQVNRMVIERERQEGTWVLSRVLLRAETTLPLPQLGRSFDVGIQFDQYAINAGLPDSLFAGAGKRAPLGSDE